MQNRLLSSLTPADQDALSPYIVQVEIERGRVLYEPGDAVDAVYFPHEGVLSLMALMNSGEAIEFAVIGPEGAAGLSGVGGAGEALCRIMAQTPVRAARMPAAALRDAMGRSPALRDRLERHNDALFVATAQSAACAALHTVEARFSRWLLTCDDRTAGDTISLTQEFLADLLGVQRTTVTAVARALQERDLIRYRRGLVEIRDRRGLEAMACECHRVVRESYERLLPGLTKPETSGAP